MVAFKAANEMAKWAMLALAPVLMAGILTGKPAGAETIRISDGDTFWMGEDEIRLWGIDAPEWDTAAGRASDAFLRGVLEGLTTADVSCDRRYRDPYDRWVAQCRLPTGEDLACVLVRAGHARDWPKYSAGYYQRCRPSADHS